MVRPISRRLRTIRDEYIFSGSEGELFTEQDAINSLRDEDIEAEEDFLNGEARSNERENSIS